MPPSRLRFSFVLLALFGSVAPVAASDAADPIAPSRATQGRWLPEGPVASWGALEGKLVFVQRYSTWNWLCRPVVPWLNELQSAYSELGFVAVGVTDEPAHKVMDFRERVDAEYGLVSEVGSEFGTNELPWSWLFAPDGRVVWSGHPWHLSTTVIEAHLPRYRLPKKSGAPDEYGRARAAVERGSYGEAHAILHSLAREHRSAAKLARALEEFGERRLRQLSALTRRGCYGPAQRLARRLERSFKGHPIAARARATATEWKSSALARAEIVADEKLGRARDLLARGRAREARPLLESAAKIADPKTKAPIRSAVIARRVIANRLDPR